MNFRIVRVIPVVLCALACLNARAESIVSDLDALAPPYNDSQDIPALYREMGVVQRKAFVKNDRFLLDSHFSVDFSDGPYTMYALQLNPGYALNEYWEVYLNIAPFFVSKPRSIVAKVEQLQLENGDKATITFSKPKLQYGAEIFWTPAYGKDSMIGDIVVRSDSFLKAGVAMTQFQDGSGMRFFGGIGKSFFLTRFLSYRFSATGAYAQTILDGTKGYSFMAFLELGVVGYF